MSTYSTLDSESFQTLLASAFAVQESQLDTQSLSAIVGVQRLITSGILDVDGVMLLIADRMRDVAKATGIAIGLLQGDRLVYRAGSGSAATYTGRHIMATLSVSAGTKTNREILRVENARTDARIEAAICRQFRADSLLILPIYHNQVVAGLLEIIFSEAHTFQESELRIYRLMASLVEEAMSHDAQLDRKKLMAAEPSTVPHAIERIASQMQKSPIPGKLVPDPPYKNAMDEAAGAAMVVAGNLPALWQPAGAARMIPQTVKRVSLRKLRWSLAAAAVVAALLVACWIGYGHRRQASPLRASALQRSNALEQQTAFAPANPALANSTSKLQTAPVAMERTRTARTTFRRVRVGENEVDYIAEGVTIRYFTPEPARQRAQGGNNQVDIGEDVTVRYFASKPMVLVPTGPASRAAQLVDRPSPMPENSVSLKPAR